MTQKTSKSKKYIPNDQISLDQEIWLKRLKHKFREGYTF